MNNGEPARVADAANADANGADGDDIAGRDRIRSAPAAVRMLVEAGPGTGKTQMAALRLNRLILSDLSPAHLLVLSFSRSAVRTLTGRMGAVAGADERVIEELRHVSVRTFDSWAFRILRLLGERPEELLRHGHDTNIRALTEAIGDHRREAVKQAIGDRRHLIVDEFQDLPGVRGELVIALLNLLAPPGESGVGFTILGDPAQAIYGFAARNEDGSPCPTPAEYWRRIVSAYGDGLETVRLTSNYRSAAPLAEMSAKLRVMLLSAASESDKLDAVREAVALLPEAADMSLKSVVESGSAAVLARTNGEALRVLTALMGRDPDGPAQPVRMRAGSYALLPPAWIAALLRPVRSYAVTRTQFDRIYDHLLGLWDDDMRASLCVPDADTAWARLALASGMPEDAASFEVSTLRTRLNWPDVFPDDQLLVDDGLIITTVHQSKGMEFDVVTILESSQDRQRNDALGEPHDEEANVSYVAITRAARTLRRAPSSSIYTAPTNWMFKNDRTRLCSWWNKWINLEMGQKGDVDPFGFVDPALHGAGGVSELQAFLLANARLLEGRKVILCKRIENNHAIWLIHLQQDDNSPGRLLGVTGKELTYDLLHILHAKGYSLPSRIMNLRISGVGTLTSEVERPLEEPENTSRLWLGVSLFGTGDFIPKKQWAGSK